MLRIAERGRVLSGITFINHNGLRWCDAPRECGPHKTLYNRWAVERYGRFCADHDGVGGKRTRQQDDLHRREQATPCVRVNLRKDLIAHCTASSLGAKKGGVYV